MSTIKWGIISTANIGVTQVIPALKRASNADVLAIASRDSKVYAVAEDLGIERAYENYESLLDDPDVEAVYIPLPNHLHLEWVKKAAEKGKHILCEKPATLNVEEAVAMVDICKKHGVQFMEAFMYQFHPQHQRVRDIIASGEIGEVKLFKSSHTFFLGNRQTDIRMQKEMGGGALYDVGCYCIHAMRTILETEPINIQVYAELDREKGVDLTSLAHLELENGVHAQLDCSFDMTSRNEYEIVGTKGTVKVPYAFRPDLNGGIGEVIVKVGETVRTEKWLGDIYRLEVEHVSNLISGKETCVNTEESTIKNMRVIEAGYQSIQSRSRINI